MNSKKVWMIIILAGILAFITAAVIIDKQTRKLKAYEEPTVKEEVIKEEPETVVEEQVEEPQEVKELPAPKKVVKKSTPPKASTPKVKPVPVVSQPEIQKPEPDIKAEEKTETSNEIVILEEYKSKNSYKYTYTPVRYKSK